MSYYKDDKLSEQKLRILSWLSLQTNFLEWIIE